MAINFPSPPQPDGTEWLDTTTGTIWVYNLDDNSWTEKPSPSIAAQVSYTYPGGVEQTLQARLEEHVSVRDFGAVGDGVTNDNAAIEDAFDSVVAAGGGTVYFPAGTYLVTTQFWYSGVDIAIRGESRSNTVIKYGSLENAKIFRIDNGDNCTVSNLTFDFNGCTKEFADSIQVNNCENVVVRDCAFLDLNPLQISPITIGTGDGTKTEFILQDQTSDDYQIMPGTVVVTAGSVGLDDSALADGHLFLTDPSLDSNGKIAPNQTTQGQILYGDNNGSFSIRVKFQVAPAAGVPVTLEFGYADQRQPILILNCSDVLVTNNILKCLGRIKIGRPGNRIVVTNNIVNGCNDNAITVVNVNPTGESADPTTVSPQPRLICNEIVISNNNVNHAATNAIFWGGDGSDKVPFPLEYHSIQVTNNNVTCSGGSAMKFMPSAGLDKSGRINIADNNIEMQYITADDGTIIKVTGPNLFTSAINFASGYVNDTIISNNNIDSTGATLAAVSYGSLFNCIFTGNRFNSPTQRVFRGNGTCTIENCVFNDNLFICGTVIAPQTSNASVIKGTTFAGNVLITDNTIRDSGSLVNGGSLEDVIISTNLFQFADGITVPSTPLSAIYLDNTTVENTYQVTNNLFAGGLYWNPDIVRTGGAVTFGTGTTKFPNSGPRIPGLIQGTGTPEGVVFAVNGSIFVDGDTGKVYAKASGGSSSNTGWVTPS